MLNVQGGTIAKTVDDSMCVSLGNDVGRTGNYIILAVKNTYTHHKVIGERNNSHLSVNINHRDAPSNYHIIYCAGRESPKILA